MSSPPAGPHETHEAYEPGQNPRRWKALAVCLVAGFMSLLDISIVNVALPSIQTGLGASDSALQWVLSGYALTFGLALVPAGRLGDARSRRTVFMTGVALFTLTSAAAGAAQHEWWLVVARLVQGVAGGVMMPQVSGFVQQLFTGAERGRAFGLLGAVIALSTAVGPLLGGVLIQAFGPEQGWRWVFYVNLPIGLAALPLARRLLPAHPPIAKPAAELRRRGSDPVGTLLLGSAVLLILLPFLQERLWPGWQKWLLEPAGVLLILVFVWWERRAARGIEPLVHMDLFRRRSYALGTLLSLLYFAGFTAIFFTYTLFLQNGLRYSALLAGVASVPFALGSALSAAVGGRLVLRFGRAMVACGLLMVTAGLLGTMLAVHQVPGEQAGWAAAGPLLLAGLGSGLVITPNQTLTLSQVPVIRAGSAGGVLQTGQRIGGAAGIATVGAVFFARLASSGGDWAASFQLGMLMSTAFVLVALLVALYDLFGPGSARYGRVGRSTMQA
ncbi:MFS transporter [Acrocarpospora phusangensis]|uniref:MFS transporter n=1 Tax=Acrocarpospora phusangensis TaxID=1070424 RepID=A0A919QFH4_9ACTN|nr:MFS transporter [Acrocarpospora phusangensis]GIH26430.1 MFS transporter [Acrocarpospora phusangensis]